MTDAPPTKNLTRLPMRPPLLPFLKACRSCRSSLPTRPLSTLPHPPLTQINRTTGFRSRQHFSTLTPCGTPSQEARILSLGRGKLPSRSAHLSMTNFRPFLQSLHKTRIPSTLIIYLTVMLVSFPRHTVIQLKIFKL